MNKDDVYTLIVKKFSLGKDEFGSNIYIYRPLELQIGFVSEDIFYNDNGREYHSIENISFVNREYDEGYYLAYTKEELEEFHKVSDNAAIYRFYQDIIDNKLIVSLEEEPNLYTIKVINKDILLDNEMSFLYDDKNEELGLSLDSLKEIIESGDLEKLKNVVEKLEEVKSSIINIPDEEKKPVIEQKSHEEENKEDAFTKEQKKELEEEILRQAKAKELEELFNKEEAAVTITKKDIRDLYADLKSKVIGQDEAIETACYTIYKNAKLKDGETKTNCIFIGPTGSGKSMITDIIGEFLKGKPLVHIDSNSLSTTGYVGANVEDCLSQLLVKADGNKFIAEHGIVVFDEVDKKGTKDNGDVGGKGVINQLLRFVEGQQYTVEYYWNNKKRSTLFDTTNLTVFACGAFPEVYEQLINKTVSKNTIGFNGNVRSLDAIEQEKKDAEKELEIAPGDLASKGKMGPEFTGRFIIAPLHKLDKEALVKIMTESKVSPLNKEIDLLEEDDVIFYHDDKFVDAIAEMAYNEGSGGRGVKNSIDQIFKKIIKKTIFTLDDDLVDADGKVYLYGTTNEEGKVVVNTSTGENLLDNDSKEKKSKVLTKNKK